MKKLFATLLLLFAGMFMTTALAINYDLYVAGTRVSDNNCNNITSPYITAGTVKYDPETNTLTLNGVQFEATGNDAPIGIQSAISDITLVFTGKDQDWTTSNHVFYLCANAAITGDCARVYLTSTNMSGIAIGDFPTAFSINTTGAFVVKGAEYGYCGQLFEKLTLSKSSDDTWGYTFEGAKGAIKDLAELKLDNMDFAYREGYNLPGCYFDPNQKSVVQNGGEIAKGRVAFQSIKEKIPISIGGKTLNRVYPIGYPIAVGSPNISGGPKSVMYDPEYKILTLNDVKISGTLYFYEEAKVKVNVKGNNSIKANTFFGIVLHRGAEVTFDGDGILDVQNEGLVGININGLNSKVIITGNLLVKAKGYKYGIGGSNSGQMGETLIIDGNAVVEASSIGELASITLKRDQKIVEPSGAVIYNDGRNGYCVYAKEGSSNLAQNVVIMPANYTAIADAQTSNLKSQTSTLYDLNGRKVNGQTSKGIYIVGGKKVLR